MNNLVTLMAINKEVQACVLISNNDTETYTSGSLTRTYMSHAYINREIRFQVIREQIGKFTKFVITHHFKNSIQIGMKVFPSSCTEISLDI